MKKILFIIITLQQGGAERQTVTVACALKRKGYNVNVLSFGKGDFYGHLLQSAEVPFFTVFGNQFQRAMKVRHFVRKGNYDVVISMTDTPNFTNDFAAFGGKSWKVIEGLRETPSVNTFSGIRGKIYNWFHIFADIIVSNSLNASNVWIQFRPQDKEKLRVIYNIVNLQPINSVYFPKRDGRLHILMAARYDSVKNGINIVEAINKMSSADRCKVKIDWYGKKYLNANVQKMEYDFLSSKIIKYGLEDEFSLNDETSDIASRMYEADAVGIFSKREGLPNAICEGMMMGKPIIMTRVSDYKALVNDSNGVLCDWDNPDSIKDAILQLSNFEEEKLKCLGEISKQKALAYFAEDNVIKQWIKVIES